MSPIASYLVETAVTLLAVIALAVLILFGARKLGVGRPTGPMQLLGRLPIDARRTLYLVQVGGRVLVLGASEAGLTRLAQMRPDQLPPAASPVTQSFADVLSKLRSQRSPANSSPQTSPTRAQDTVDAEDNA